MRGKVLAIMVAVAACGFAPLVSADSLSVTAGAAMGGTNYGLAVFHDNTDICYVRDTTPANETIYRYTFLFRTPPSANATAAFRQPIFVGWGHNPAPTQPTCPSNPAAYVGAIRVFLFAYANGTLPSVQVWGRGNWCGDQGALRTNLAWNTEYRICGEYWAAAAGTGGVGLAVVAPSAACPAHGAGYNVVNYSNEGTSIDIVDLGTPLLNSSGANEDFTMAFDEFASFRTLAP